MQINNYFIVGMIIGFLILVNHMDHMKKQILEQNKCAVKIAKS